MFPTSQSRFALRVLAVAAIITSFAAGADAGENLAAKSHHRQPTAVLRLGEDIVVLNRRAATLTRIRGREVVDEQRVGERPVAMAAVGDRGELLVCDAARHSMILLRREGSRWQPVLETTVARHPRSVAVDGHLAAVSSSWSRRVTLVDTNDRSRERIRIVDLPFLGGRIVSTPAGFVVAAEGEGRLAVIDGDGGEILRTIELPGHNVGGMFYDTARRELLVTQQMLKDDTSTTYENVFWGGVLKNVLQSIPLAELNGKRTADARVAPPDLAFLGFPSDAAGDPADVFVTKRGQTIVSIGGVDSVHVRASATSVFEAFAADRRPAGIAVSADGSTAYVCNTYSDSITTLDLHEGEQSGRISLGPSPEPTLVDRGESLFHDARLSLDGWYSCHSCHTNGHSSGQRTDNLGDGYFGDPKRIPSLLGTHGTGPWAWNGSSKTLEDQIRKSILKTMRGEAAADEDVDALVAFMRTFEPPPSLAEARGDRDSEDAERGRRLFETKGCADCHAGSRLTTADVYDVGLVDQSENKEFNPPSLRGVSQRSSFLHDGRAKSLRDVLEKVRHPNETKLTREEIDDLLEYLRGL